MQVCQQNCPTLKKKSEIDQRLANRGCSVEGIIAPLKWGLAEKKIVKAELYNFNFR